MSSRLGSRRLFGNSPRCLMWSNLCALRASVSNTYWDDWIMHAHSPNEVWNIQNKLSTSSVFELNDQLNHVDVTILTHSGLSGVNFNLVRALSPTDSFYQFSPMSYPVSLHQQSCLLANFILQQDVIFGPRSYTVTVFTYTFSSSGSKPSGLTFSSRGIRQSSWMHTSSPTFTGFTNGMSWQVFRYIFRNPTFSSLLLHSWRDGAPVG